jgi:hypothetical protein
MGNYATGKIFFGIPLDEENAQPWDEDDTGREPEEVYVEKIFGHKPHDLDFTYDYGKHTNWEYVEVWAEPDKAKENKAKLNAWYEKNQALSKQCPIEIGRSGCDSYSVPYIYIKGSEFSADYSEFRELDPSKLFIQPEWYDILKKACEALNIEWQEPKFYITAYYG